MHINMTCTTSGKVAHAGTCRLNYCRLNYMPFSLLHLDEASKVNKPTCFTDCKSLHAYKSRVMYILIFVWLGILIIIIPVGWVFINHSTKDRNKLPRVKCCIIYDFFHSCIHLYVRFLCSISQNCDSSITCCMGCIDTIWCCGFHIKRQLCPIGVEDVVRDLEICVHSENIIFRCHIVPLVPVRNTCRG